jgi:predicted RNA binding protein YcfA (HicA-like mRNA interferase family)
MNHRSRYTCPERGVTDVEFVCIITHMNSRDIIRKLKQDGWVGVAVVGSHHQFKHPIKPGRVTVPHPVKDMPIGTLKSIAHQARIKLA